MKDAEIIALYNARSEQAIAVTKNQYGRFCYGIAMNILRSPEDAEECENDTYHAAWRRIPPDQPRTLRAYLGTITRNLSISRYRAIRAAKRSPNVEILFSELEDCVSSKDCVDENIAAKELSETISRWLCGLSREARALFVWRYWYGESVSELSARFQMPNSRISQQLHRLRKQLKAFLRKEGIEL